MVVDNMAMAGLDIADPPQALVDWLKPLGIAAGEGKLVDLTLAGAKPEIVAGTIERLLADDGNDAAIFVVGSSAQFNPELAVEPLLKFAGSKKPFAVSLTPAAEKSLALLTAAGVPAFRHPESCAEAMALCLLRPTPQPDADAGRAVGGGARGARGRPGLGLRRAAGDGTVRGARRADGEVDGGARCARASRAAVDEVGAPVALKILSADIAHKTEAGGVALGLPDGQTAAVAAREIEKRVKAHAPNAKLDGFLVQKMERGLAEVILGFRRDPLVGPTITVGLGGVLAEIYKDAATRLAPVDEAEALQMIGEVKGLATIRGYRNLPKGDVAALARAIAAFSALGAPGVCRGGGSGDQSAAGQAGGRRRRRRRRVGGAHDTAGRHWRADESLPARWYTDPRDRAPGASSDCSASRGATSGRSSELARRGRLHRLLRRRHPGRGRAQRAGVVGAGQCLPPSRGTRS